MSRVVATAVLLLAASAADAYTLVLKGGVRAELAAEPRFVDGWSDVVTRDGRRSRVPVVAVAWAETNAANGLPPEHRCPGAELPKVWTAADLAALRSVRLSFSGGPGPAGPETAEASSPAVVLASPTGSAGGAAGEAEWRSRAAENGRRLAEAENAIAFLERQEAAWESVALGLPGVAGGAGHELAQVRAQLAAARADRAAALAQRAALEEEARRANVPPGWLR